MKTSRCCSITAAMIGIFVSSHAQILSLSGHVTARSGLFTDLYAIGAPVKWTLDFTTPPTDYLNGTQPHQPIVFVSGSFTIDGTRAPELGSEFIVGLTDNLHNGLLYEGLHSGFTNGNYSPGQTYYNFSQQFFSDEDILSSAAHFPEGISMDRFDVTAGFYSLFPAEGGSGRIDWVMTSYTGSADIIIPPGNDLNAVPEPATYGIFGTLVLMAVSFARRRRKCSQPPVAATDSL